MGTKLRTKFSWALVFVVCIAAFQNCSQQTFDVNQDSLSSSSLSFSSEDGVTYAATKKNVSVQFKFETLRQSGVQLSFASSADLRLLTTAHGKFEILNPAALDVRYTPNSGFVGVDRIDAFLRDAYGNNAQGGIEVTVGNVLGKIQPALAVRGISCVACHANIHSNVVTDMGFGGADAGRDYFFNASSWNWNVGFYGDHGGAALETMNVGTGASIMVPKAVFPSTLAASAGADTLQSYFKKVFARSAYPGTVAAPVVAMNTVRISLPTADRLRALFGRPATAWVYEKETQSSPALAGLSYSAANQVFTVTDLTCDGDLFLEGTLLLKGAKIRSLTGCRLYVTGSVFVQEGLTAVSTSASSDLANIQIASAKSVWLGTGSLFKNGTRCEHEGIEARDASETNSFHIRMQYMVNYRANVRQTADLNAFRDSINAESAKLGDRADASCDPGGRTFAFQRLLIAAPWVNSRYNGNFSGSIVAEDALMALSAFKFEFDPVFRTTSVLPKLDPNELLDVH